MPRIVKDHEERLDEFIAIATELFFLKGYECTTVQMILDQMGVSKGSFYHYFKSKEELLDQMVQRRTAGISEMADGIVSRLDLTAPQKIREFSISLMRPGATLANEMIILFRNLFSEHNLRFRHKFNNAMMRTIRPFLEKVIAQGEGEGTFQVTNRRSAAEIIVTLFLYYGEVIFTQFLWGGEETVERVSRRVEALIVAMERILGLEHGTFGSPSRAAVGEFAHIVRGRVMG